MITASEIAEKWQRMAAEFRQFGATAPAATLAEEFLRDLLQLRAANVIPRMQEYLHGRVRIEPHPSRPIVSYFAYPHRGPHPDYDVLRAMSAEMDLDALVALAEEQGYVAAAESLASDVEAP